MSSAKDLFAKVVLASKPTNGALPLVTMHMHYPDIIHGEVLTHRMFTRNARSTRAVPVATMVNEVRENPFVPWHWGKNQKGMQASEECNEPVDFSNTMFRDIGLPLTREAAWQFAANSAADFAEAFGHSGYHKQVANRLIAPFTWKHTLISSTSWANFLHLRDHEDAEPHFHDLAAIVREALANAEYQSLEPGQWHLPYITEADKEAVEDYLEPYPETTHPSIDILRKLSVARSARISYAPFDGNPSIERELERYDLLVGSSPLHASPTEHQATPDRTKLGLGYPNPIQANPHLSGNFGAGWIQFRKMLAGEYVKDIA